MVSWLLAKLTRSRESMMMGCFDFYDDGFCFCAEMMIFGKKVVFLHMDFCLDSVYVIYLNKKFQ